MSIFVVITKQANTSIGAVAFTMVRGKLEILGGIHQPVFIVGHHDGFMNLRFAGYQLHFEFGVCFESRHRLLGRSRLHPALLLSVLNLQKLLHRGSKNFL